MDICCNKGNPHTVMTITVRPKKIRYLKNVVIKELLFKIKKDNYYRSEE